MAFIRERSWKTRYYARYTIGSLFLQIYLWPKSQDISLLKWFGQFRSECFSCKSSNFVEVQCKIPGVLLQPKLHSVLSLIKPVENTWSVYINHVGILFLSSLFQYMFNCQIPWDVSQTMPCKNLHIFSGMKLKVWCVFHSCTPSYRFPPLKTFEMLLLQAWQDIIK